MLPLVALLLTPGFLSPNAPGPLADVPFEHANGRVWMKATLNGKPMETMLDSGAWGLFAFEDAALRAGATKGETLSVQGVGETNATGWRTHDLRFALAETRIESPVPYIIAPARPLPGRKIEVAAGFDFLLRYAVEIDYDATRLRIFNPWTYRPGEGYQTLRVRFADRRPIVEAQLELPGLPPRTVAVMIDTGFPGGMDLSRKLAIDAGLDATFGQLPTEDAPGGVGGPTRRKRLGRTRLSLAGATIDVDTTLSMTEGGANGAKALYDVLLGDEALRRFDVAFDYWHGRVHLRPRASHP